MFGLAYRVQAVSFSPAIAALVVTPLLPLVSHATASSLRQNHTDSASHLNLCVTSDCWHQVGLSASHLNPCVTPHSWCHISLSAPGLTAIMLLNLTCISAFIIIGFLHGSKGYNLEVEPKNSIPRIVEGTSTTARVYLTDCSGIVTNVSLTVVETGALAITYSLNSFSLVHILLFPSLP